MKKIDKMAAQDAFKWARAEMFFGEGAGTRRKLLLAEISDKVHSIPGYEESFNRAYAGQDMAKHAIAAAKERQRIDAGKYIRRNAKGLATGNIRSLTPYLAVGVSTWIFLQQTGLDEPVKVEVKKQYKKAKNWVEIKRREYALKADKDD